MAGFIDELTKWEEEAKFWRDEGTRTGTEVAKAEDALPWWLKVFGWGWLKALPSIAGAGATVPRILYPAITGKPMPPEVLDPLKAIDLITATEKYGSWTNTVDRANRADFFATLYRTAPTGIALGRITSFEDFMAQLGGVSEGSLSSEDIAEARKIINQMLATGVPAEGPEWLEVAPAEERAVTEFLTTPMETKPRFVGVHVTTVEEITKWLQKEIPAPELPLGMTDVGLLNAAKSMGLTEEQVNIAADYDEMMGIIGEVWAEQQQLVDDVKAGRAEYDMPRLEGAELAKYIALQPLQAVADMVSPYLEHVNYPMAGWAIHNIREISPITGIFVPEGTWGYDELYERSRATNNWWDAHAMAWESWDVNWGVKLAVEVAVDPLTYVGLGIYPRIFATCGKFGRAVAASERWFNYASDIPFQYIKNQWARIPRVPSQVMRAENERFIAVMDAAVRGHVARTKGVAKTAQQLTKDDIMDAVTFSIEHYKTNPELGVRGTDDFYAEFGRYLTDIAPITPAQTLAWSEAVDGKLILSDITNRTVDDVNNIVYDHLVGKGSVAEQTPKLLSKLMAESNAATQRRAKLILNRQTSQHAKRIERLTELEDPGKIIEAMTAQQRKILDAQVRSQFFKTRSEHGIVAALMGHVSHMESTLWRNILDRYAVRPMAEAYLGFSGYPIWNAFEDMFRSAVEGVLPRQMSLEHMQLLSVGINAREARLLTGGASDVRGMLGTLPGREGLISFLPGKLPEAVTARIPLLGKTIGGAQWTEWLGRHWIELSNVWGNAFRRNFVGRKYLHYLAEFGRDFQGKDVTKLIDDAITKAGKEPTIRGIKPSALRNEIAARVQTGEKSIVLDLKKAINNNSLMQQEQRKILQQAAELTPQARTLGEQMIATGEAIDNPNVFAKAIADQAVADIKTYPAQVVDNFEHMADKIMGESITTPDEIMQAFQHLTVMQDTAGCIPHRLMAKTHEISDDLMAKGKYGKVVDQLWRKERTEMFDVMDRISVANNKVRQKILDAIPDVGLTPNQQSALRELLEHTNIRDSLKTSAMLDDGDLLDVFWSKSKAERTKEAYQTLRADRFELWEAYRIADADYFGNEFIMRKSYQELYYKMPKRPPLSVDASGRVLVPNDIARILDSNVDGVSKEIVENVAFQDRYHFTKLIRKLADSNPTAFKGFTEDKIHQVYNIILDNMRLTPDMDIQIQKVLMQVEGIKQEMITLKQIKAMTLAEEKEFFSWVDRVGTNMDDLPVYKAPGEVMDEWTQLRQRSWDEGLKDYYKAYTDYSHENIIDHVMRHIFPYWTYEVQRWFFIPRTFIRRPGTLMAWGKYNEYSEHGYVPVPGTDLQINLARGSVFGLTFGLTRRDYPYHYQQLGPMAEVTDALMRFGFYPGIHFMFPIVTTPAFTGRPPNWGESLPALYKTGLNVLATSPIPKVSEDALWLQDHVFHDNFRDYQVVTKIDEMQVKAGGTLIGGQTGQDLWDKRMAGDWGISADERRNMEIKLEGGLLTPEEIEAWEEKKRLADEEETVWNEAARYRAWLGLLMENIPVFRYRPEEQVEAFKRVTELIEAQTGLTAEQQDYLWKHNLRPSDVCPAIMSPTLRRAMNEMWEYKLFLGRSTVIKPQRWSELDMKTSKFWKQVDTYQQERRTRQEEINVGFLTPTTALHFTGREWIEQKAANWNTYMGRYDDLKKSDEYAEVAITLEERAAQLQEQGFPAPTASMFDEALRLYFQVKPEVVRNKYTGEEDIDWSTFHLKREAIIKGLPPEQQEEFTTYIRAYETPLERRFREICNTYFRGYWAVTNIILNQYSEGEKALIAEYYSDLTTHARREEIQAYVRETGRQLISEYTSRLSDARIKLRTVSPTLDYYLTIFGYVSVPRTDEAKAMVYAFDRDRMVLIR